MRVYESVCEYLLYVVNAVGVVLLFTLMIVVVLFTLMIVLKIVLHTCAIHSWSHVCDVLKLQKCRNSWQLQHTCE